MSFVSDKVIVNIKRTSTFCAINVTSRIIGYKKVKVNKLDDKFSLWKRNERRTLKN